MTNTPRWHRPLAFVTLWLGLLGLLLHVPAAHGQGGTPFQFSHTPLASAPPGQPLSLRCKATENDELDDVYLYYRTKGETTFTAKRMKLNGGIQYSATIPGARVKRPHIEYYIMGVDTARKTHWLFGTPTSPHKLSIKVVAARSATTPTPAANTSSESDDEEDTVYSASRREQRIQRAPSIVTVVTAADIKANGWRSLLEILRYVAGIDINDNGHWADLGVRGVNPRVSYGDKMVILLDGHNMAWRQFNRNYLNPSWVTVDNIKRIEVIRGPGSSLWGANAISGVINIITKTAQDLKGLEATGGLSPLSRTYFLTLQGGQRLGNGVTLRASFSLHRQNRSPILAPIREFLQLSEADLQILRRRDPRVSYETYDYVPLGDQFVAQNFYVRLAWRGVSLSFHQSRYDPQAPMSTFSQLGGDDSRFVTDRYFTKLSWATPLRSWGTLFLWTSLDYYEFGQGTAYESNPLSIVASERTLTKMAARDTRLEAGAQFSAQVYTSNRFGLSLITGLDYEYLNVMRWHFPEVWHDNALATPYFSNHHFSAFLQVQASFIRAFHITLGGRLDFDSIYGAVFTPRAALVITPGAGLFAKLLYGNAFKAPSFHDLYYFRKDAFYGNRDLKPESVHTFELQVGWQRKRLLSVSATGYLSLFRDLIAYAQRSAGEALTGAEYFPASQRPSPQAAYTQKDNTTDLSIFGGELEFRLYPTKGLNIVGNAGLFLGHSGALGSPGAALLYSAQWKASLTASYRFRAGPIGLSFALGALLTSPKRVPPKAYQPNNARFDVVGPNGARLGVPQWAADDVEAKAKNLPLDPTLATPLAVRSFITVQALGILKHIDLSVRLSNVLNRFNYDASDLLLYPQEKLDLMIWMKVKY